MKYDWHKNGANSFSCLTTGGDTISVFMLHGHYRYSLYRNDVPCNKYKTAEEAMEAAEESIKNRCMSVLNELDVNEILKEDEVDSEYVKRLKDTIKKLSDAIKPFAELPINMRGKHDSYQMDLNVYRNEIVKIEIRYFRIAKRIYNLHATFTM